MEQLTSFFTNNLERYLEILHDMVSKNSFTYAPDNVNHLGQYTAALFENLGFESIFQPARDSRFGKHLFLIKNSSSTAEWKNSPTIACISHLDTVFSVEEETQNDFLWRREANKIYGPGTVDIKGGTVMIYMLLEAIRAFDRNIYDQINWYVMLDACEEALSHDFGESVREMLPQNVIGCLVFEGGTTSNSEVSLVTSRKGRATFDIEVKGRSAHAGNAHQQGANAIVEIAKVIIDISKLTDYSNDLTINIGKVFGGSVVNRVPHEAYASGEIRAFSPEILDYAIQKVLDRNNRNFLDKENENPCQTTIKMSDKMPPWPANQKTNTIYKYWELAGEEMGISVFEEARGGLSDGNYLSNYFPTIDGLGPAGGNAHCSEQNLALGKQQEYVDISSFVHKGTLNLSAILKLASNALQNLNI